MTKLQTILVSAFSALLFLFLAGFIGMTLFFGLQMKKEVEANQAAIAQVVDFINKGIEASQKASAQTAPTTGQVNK